MNKIIWKNISSTTINGLIISELPSITKPKMRVQETKIDGVDGSVIEKLGYSDYDKTIKIGLCNEYDIDEVIQYFSGEGHIIFGNEEDKYYNAQIIKEINYQKLLNFKTANVVFRVQPFKYKVNEEAVIITETGTFVENCGTEISKPKMLITGTGTVEIFVNDLLVFRYTFPEDETQVIIDSEKQDAYLGSLLKNRNMTGDFPVFFNGNNKVSWNGNITKIEIEPKSRWL